jgi:chromosome segregation ATPase
MPKPTTEVDPDNTLARAFLAAVPATRQRPEIDRDIDDLLSDDNLDAHRISASIAAAIRRLLAERDQLREENTRLAKQAEEQALEIQAHEIHAENMDDANADLTGALDDVANRDRTDFAALADAAEQLHRQAHGDDTGLRVCLREPCAGLHNVLPNALGKAIA